MILISGPDMSPYEVHSAARAYTMPPCHAGNGTQCFTLSPTATEVNT